MAARVGGGLMETNPRLRVAHEKAKAANMPKDNIEKAIKKGTGELPGVVYEEATYEGYGPGGVALLVEVLSDNKNRTSSELRNIFNKKNGNMAGAGSVSWQFHKKGFIVVDKNTIAEEKLLNIVLENGGEDMVTQEETYEITTSLQDFDTVKKALEANHVATLSAELTMIPSATVKIAEKSVAHQVLGLISALEDHDDVQNVYANFDIPDAIIAEVSE